jgi:hypothetical protein
MQDIMKQQLPDELVEEIQEKTEEYKEQFDRKELIENAVDEYDLLSIEDEEIVIEEDRHVNKEAFTYESFAGMKVLHDKDPKPFIREMFEQIISDHYMSKNMEKQKT